MHRRALLPALWLSVACTLAEPPTCEDVETAACFKGAFRGLLGDRLPGAEVCALDLPDVSCVTTDEEGTWKLPGLPLDTNVALTATLEGTVPTVFPQHTSMAWYDWYKVLVPLWVMDSNASSVEVSLDPDKGHVLFLVWEGLNIDGVDTSRVAGVSAVDLSGEGVPFYAGALGLADGGLTETSGQGSGGLLNLTPGVHEVAFTSPGGPCETQMFHWAYERPNVIPVPVRAGFTTAIDVMCPPQTSP